MRPERHTRLATALGLAAAAWLLVLAVAGADHAVLYFVPALLLALPLAGGHYPGEERIERLLVRGRDQRLRARSEALPARHRGSRRPVFAGGRLLAGRLAGRGPPAAA